MRIFIVATMAGRMDGRPSLSFVRVILEGLRRPAMRTLSKSNDTFIPPCHCHVRPPLSEMAAGSVAPASTSTSPSPSPFISTNSASWSLMAADGRSHCRRLRVWIFGIFGATCYEFFRVLCCFGDESDERRADNNKSLWHVHSRNTRAPRLCLRFAQMIYTSSGQGPVPLRPAPSLPLSHLFGIRLAGIGIEDCPILSAKRANGIPITNLPLPFAEFSNLRWCSGPNCELCSTHRKLADIE